MLSLYETNSVISKTVRFLYVFNRMKIARKHNIEWIMMSVNIHGKCIKINRQRQYLQRYYLKFVFIVCLNLLSFSNATMID